MSLPDPAALDEAFARELAVLVGKVQAGTLPAAVVDEITAERWLLRLVGAVLWLRERHRIDEDGRCPICRAPRRRWWWPWPTRTTCTVHRALRFYLHQPGWAVLAVLADGYLTVRDPP